MQKTRSADQLIIEEVASWPGVEVGPGRFGSVRFALGKRELGHLHGDRLADLPFTRALRDELVAAGTVVPHRPLPDSGWASRHIDSEEDARAVIDLLRMQYDRALAGRSRRTLETPVPGLHASTPQALPFGRSLHARAYLLRRAQGNLLLYRSDELRGEAAAVQRLGGIARQYLNHAHEASPTSDWVAETFHAPLLCHEDDAPAARESARVSHTFSRRHHLQGDFEVIPTPGHTPGATAYLWDSGEHRCLFTGDTLSLRDGEWVAAVLDGVSDREAYLESLELIRGLDFDVLVPWVASGQPSLAFTDRADTERRIDAVSERLRSGADH